jgi:hypothetical protein
MTANITTIATDPIVYGINYHRDHRTQGATSNPGTVQAHIDRSIHQATAHQTWISDWHNDPQHNVAPTTTRPLPDHGYDPTAGHHAPFLNEREQAVADVEAQRVAQELAADRKFWQTENLFDHIF